MYLAHYTKRFIPEFDAECRFNPNDKISICFKALWQKGNGVMLKPRVAYNEKSEYLLSILSI